MHEPALHAWNRSVTWIDHQGPFRRVTVAQARAYDEQGFFVLEDAFDAATMPTVIGAIDPFEEQSRGVSAHATQSTQNALERQFLILRDGAPAE